MKLETEEPFHKAFVTLVYALENPVIMDPFVVADFQGSEIDITYSGTLAEQHLLISNSHVILTSYLE